MKRSPSWWRLGASGLVAGAAIVYAAAPASADRPVELSFRETPGHARIVARWADGDETAPRITATVSNQVLILSFDQKVTLNLPALEENLPSWAAVTRMDPDGRTARIGLRQTPRVKVSRSIDLVAVDLIPESIAADPPAIVSPLVAQRQAEAAAERAAAIPPPATIVPLEIRSSHAGDSSRVAFYWSAPVSYSVVGEEPGKLTLLFSRRAETDLAYMRIAPPENVDTFTSENTDRGFQVTLTAKDGIPIRRITEGGVTVLDITRPPPPPDPEDEGGDGGKPQVYQPDSGAPAVVRAQPQPVQQAVQTPVQASAQTLNTDRPVSLAPPLALLRDSEDGTDAATAAEQVPVIGGRERTTVLGPLWSDAAPNSGVAEVTVSPLASGLELQVMFAAPAPAAVFARGSAIWAVFAVNTDLAVDPSVLPAGYSVRTLRGKDATMMRIEPPRNFTVSAEAEGSLWRVRLAPSATRPQRFVRPERRADRDGLARVEAMLAGAAGLVWFDDPVIGDKIAAAVAYGPSSASPTSLDFVEAALPATAHGLAIAPRSDNVLVTLAGERVSVAMAGGTAEPVAKAEDMPDEKPVNVAFINFAAWGGLSGDAFVNRRTELEHAAAELDPATPEGAAALFALARFYLGHELAHEALGAMQIASDNWPEITQDPRFLGLRGAANVLAYRHAAAEADLSRGALRGDPSVALWRALVASRRGDWESVGDHMRAAGDHVIAYDPDRAAHFAIAYAEAALNINDFDTARRQAELARASGGRMDVERAELVLATLASVIDGPAAAYEDLERLAAESVEPVAVRAELKRLEAGVAAGRMTANDAAGELESLRFRWRGDGVEMATVGILADQYMRVGRFREALLLTQSAAMRDVTAPGSRDLRIRLTNYFRRLFLNGEADRLDPIQALALFYEFAESLMPVGNDGDAMIRRLAQRLVAFDLLEPAAQLLQHQIDNRMRGVGQSAIAVDLATIYLKDKRPERALAAINSSRQPQLPRELALERRLIEAVAYRDLGRHDHVVELTEGVDNPVARSLLADAHWRSRNWAQSARAYLAMLPPPGRADAAEAGIVFRAAIAARLSRDASLLAEVRRYRGAMDETPNQASFDLIVSQTDVGGAALSEAVRRVADAPLIDAFAASLMDRFSADGAPLPLPGESALSADEAAGEG